ncbi:Asp-tRNA(Asn)/Glu-tRNA(Gln) amidotransferase GatCAB subunit A [bacterium DOLZORAL124_38_8]|nr:MAG: Asp-tRNA(Asn)/Glu-tRNA(Gln) amidotransferase GatCAB subunit A [bacterium DOLZORAL124_38_8]
MTKLCTLSLAKLIEKFRSGEVSSREITESFIEQIQSEDGNINAFVTTTFDLAREMADAADARRENGELLSKIDGMPIALKDVVCTAGIKTTASSNMLKNFVPPYDATVWKKLKESGVVLLGKNNTDEFTMGVSTETSAFGVTKNPHNLAYVSGGSSGGSAAAVAANMATMSVGTDTGGSIRVPAHFCGVTGLKVSYGRVSRFGTIPMASSLDTIGPIAKTPEDCAILMEIMAGKDVKDSTSSHSESLDFTSNLKNSVAGMKIGVPKEYFEGEGLDENVKQVLQAAKVLLEDLGAELVEVSLPHTKYGVAAYYILAPSEISANMARFDGIRFGAGVPKEDLQDLYETTRENGFGAEVKRRIILGTFALSAGYADQFYKKAQKVRTLIKQDFEDAFKKVDVLLAPVSPATAFKIGEQNDDPVKMYLEDMFTVPSSLAGVCGISVPFGMASTGLPVGVQFIGPNLGEDKVLQVAHNLFTATEK